MPRLSLQLLGQFHATLDGETLTGFETSKVRALLAYLAVESDRPHNRESLAGMLWPDITESNARRNLRHIIYNLRQVTRDYDAVPPFLLINRQTIQFNPVSDVQLDVQVFTEAIAATHDHPHTSLETCEVCMFLLDEAEQRLNVLGKQIDEISGAAKRFDAFLGGLRHLLNENLGPPTPTPWKTPTPAAMVTVIPLATPTP